MSLDTTVMNRKLDSVLRSARSTGCCLPRLNEEVWSCCEATGYKTFGTLTTKT